MSFVIGAPALSLVSIPRFTDERGSLCVIEWRDLLPFAPQRFYYLVDLAPGTRRGGHFHFHESELLIALNGAFSVETHDGRRREEFHLQQPDVALCIPPHVWHELHDFSPGAVCAVLASQPYDREDYGSDFEQFLEACRTRHLEDRSA